MLKNFEMFNRVVAPVMIASPDLKTIYSNPYAMRVFPFLSASSGLASRYESEALERAIEALKRGEFCALPYDEALHLKLLLQPVSATDGELSYACVYVVSDTEDVNVVFPYLADGELLRFLRKEVAEPTNLVLRQLKFMDHIVRQGDVERSLMAIKTIRTQILQMSLFYARIEDCSVKQSKYCAVANAVSVLSECKKPFSFVKYKPSETCYVPLERGSQILLYTDVLASLIYRQDNPSVTITSKCEKDGVTITFSSGPLTKPIDVPCNDEYNGLDLGLFSVRRRAELAEGTVSVAKNLRDGVNVTIKFPPVNLLMCEAIFRDSAYERPSELEANVMEYLGMIAQDFS